MATGYESYVTLMYSNPAAALPVALNHLQALIAWASTPKSEDGPTSVDPSSMAQEIARVQQDIRYLNGIVNRIGMPRIQPTRRIDNQPWPVPGVGYSP